MSKEQKEQKIKVFKGRPRVKTERRATTKKLDLKKSAELFESECFIYWPEPGFNTDEYEDDDGNVDIDAVPDEHLIEFVCRYIDPGTFQEITSTPLAYDIPEDKQLSQAEIEKMFREAQENRIRNMKSETDIRLEIILTCVIDPQFESIDQIRKILPLALQYEIYNEVTRGAIGENLVARFSKSN